ncbi:hypothetical protein HYR99_32655, partial [Candidatus Poribacteria bacterium]|nr:hypothetical protein [Candidatus Poribacteria bacterium]
MLKLDIIGQARALQTEAAIRPTVWMGLGGSGKEVLMRLRRLFYERHGTVGLPITQYLCFDTDTQEVNINREKYDEIERRLYFDDDEQVSGKIEPAKLAEYYGQSDEYALMFKWLNREALELLGTSALTQGAKQIRPLGRLAFFHSYATLRKRLEQKIHIISVNAQQVASQMGHTSIGGSVSSPPLAPNPPAPFPGGKGGASPLPSRGGAGGEIGETVASLPPIDNPVEIVIVTSLAGGTGSGSFIDMAFLAREIAPNAMITGLLFLPHVFEGNAAIAQEVIKANGYAALKELDYYLAPYTMPRRETGSPNGKNRAYPSLNFEVEWDGKPHRIPRPPFTTAYLIDNKNYLGMHTEDATDVFQMAAEFLMLDFDSSPFAATKRGVRSNMEQFLHTETQYTVYDFDTPSATQSKDFDKLNPAEQEGRVPIYVQYFPNRYAAFGLSQIQLNQPAIARAAAYTLGEYMLRFWLADFDKASSGSAGEGEAPAEPSHHRSKEVSVHGGFRALGLTTDRLIPDLLAHAYGETDKSAIENQFRSICGKITQKRRSHAEETSQSNRERSRAIFHDPNAEIHELEHFVAEIKNETENLMTSLKKLFESNLREHGVIGPHIKILQANKARRERELEAGFEEMVTRLLPPPLTPNPLSTRLGRGGEGGEARGGEGGEGAGGVNAMDGFLDVAQNEINVLIQEVQKQTSASPLDFQPHVAFEIEPHDNFAKYESRLQEAQRIPIWAGFLFARHARAMAVNYYKQKLAQATDDYFQNTLRVLERTVDEQKDALKAYIDNRYRHEALKRLANPQRTGVLDRLHTRIGSRTELKNPEGTTAIKVTGLRQNLDDFARCLIELRDDFHGMAEAYQRTPAGAGRNLNISLKIDYLEEIETYLAPRLNASNRLEMLTRISKEYFEACGLIGANDNPPPSPPAPLPSRAQRAPSFERGEETEAIDTLSAGRRELYHRATRRISNPRAWDQVRESMESFVLDQMKGLKASDTAAEHFRQSLQNNEEEIQRSLTHAVEMGAVRIQPSDLPLAELPYHPLSIIGISD